MEKVNKNLKAPRRRRQMNRVSLRKYTSMEVSAEIQIQGRYTHDYIRRKQNKECRMLFDMNHSGVVIKVKDIPQVIRELVRLTGNLAKTDAEINTRYDADIDEC